MLFVLIGKAKAGSTGKERIARRARWEYPAGERVQPASLRSRC